MAHRATSSVAFEEVVPDMQLAAVTLSELPSDVLLEVLSHISSLKDLLATIQSCRALKTFLHTPELVARWAWRQQHNVTSDTLKLVLEKCSAQSPLASGIKCLVGPSGRSLWLPKPAPVALTNHFVCHAAKTGDLAQLHWALCTDKHPSHQNGVAASTNSGAEMAAPSYDSSTSAISSPSAGPTRVGTAEAKPQTNDLVSLPQYQAALNAALLAATANGRTEVIEALLKLGADVHAEHDRALRWAALAGATGAVEVLLSHGANPHALGGFAVQAAHIRSHAAVLRVLEAHGVSATVA